MTLKEIYQFIPESFEICGYKISVELREEDTNSNCWGVWMPVANKIILYANVYENGSMIKLTKDQIIQTFYHEVFHAFLEMSGMDQNETIPQTFSNFLLQFQKTRTFKNDE